MLYALLFAKACSFGRFKFIDEYCRPSGAIDWDKLVEAACGNYDLDRFMPRQG